MTTQPFTIELEKLERCLARLENAGTQKGCAAEAMSLDELHACLEQVHVITEEMRLQNEAIAQERFNAQLERQRYQELIDSLSDAYLMTDGNGVVMEANLAAVQIFHAPERSFLMRKPLIGLALPAEASKLRGFLLRVAKSRAGASMELQFQPRKDEPPFSALISAIATGWHSADTPSQIRWQIRDLTDQKLLEQHLRQTEAQLHQSTRLASLGMMTASMVQEITDRIATMQLAAQRALKLHERPSSSQDVHEALESIVESAQHCGALAHNMVRYAKDRPTKKWFHDVNQVVLAALQRTRDFSPDRSLPAASDLAADLPKVMCDPLELELVVVNLVRNAMEAVEGHGDINVFTHLRGSKVQIEVRDNGPGMSHQQRLRAFEPFYTTKQAKRALGLGLSVARALVVAHGGSIDIHSELGQGTKVCIDLPAAEEEGP